MNYVKLPELGIVIRKSSLAGQNVSRSTLLSIMESETPYDENNELISFGPHFGNEAVLFFINKLEGLNLIYGVDFYDFMDTTPEWLQLGVSLQTGK